MGRERRAGEGDDDGRRRRVAEGTRRRTNRAGKARAGGSTRPKARAREAEDVAQADESGEGDGRLMEDLAMIWMDQWCLGSIARGVR